MTILILQGEHLLMCQPFHFLVYAKKQFGTKRDFHSHLVLISGVVMFPGNRVLCSKNVILLYL